MGTTVCQAELVTRGSQDCQGRMAPQDWWDLQACPGEDQEVTQDLQDLLGPEDSLDHLAHLARTVLTDLRETKVYRVKQEARV